MIPSEFRCSVWVVLWNLRDDVQIQEVEVLDVICDTFAVDFLI